MSVPSLAEATPRFSIVVDDLGGLSDEDLRARAVAAFPRLALWALRDARSGRDLLANMVHWAHEFQMALRAPGGAEALAHLLRYIARFAQDVPFDAFHAKLIQIVPAAEDAAMTIAEELRQKGWLGAKQETLVNLLKLKFGSLSDEHRARIEHAELADLDRYIERVLTADTLDAVFAD